MPKPLMKLLSPKVCVKIGQWNVRTMFERGKCAQVVKEMRRYGISILGVSEMRWSSCGKVMTATGETVLYSGTCMDEGEHHERGVGLILSKDATQSLLELEPVSERIIRARFPIWQFTSLTTGTKLSVFGSTVKAMLLYGAETWRLTKELKQKLQVFINKCLRSILRIWWPRRIRNDELWRQTGQRPIEEEIKERAWRWIGHTLRRTDGHVAKTALE